MTCTKNLHGKWSCWKQRLFTVVVDMDIRVWISDVGAVHASTDA